MAKPLKKDYSKLLKKAYDAESKAFKQWDKNNFLKAADFFKESASLFEQAKQESTSIDERVLTSSNIFVELSNYYWVLGLKKYSDDEDYDESAELFKKAIINKKKALEADKEDLPLRKGLSGQKEVKRREWRLFQQSTLRELYAYYFLSVGLKAEKDGKLKLALENFENAAASYNQQIRHLRSFKKPYFLVKLYLLKANLKIAECKKELNKTSEAISDYKELIKQVEALDKRHRRRAEAILALAQAELGECYKDLDEIGEASKYYWKFLDWAKKVKLDKEQASEVARCICILTVINIKLRRICELDKAIREYRTGKIFGKKIREVQRNPWYRLSALIVDYYERNDEAAFKDARVIYEKMIDKKDKFITAFFEEKHVR